MVLGFIKLLIDPAITKLYYDDIKILILLFDTILHNITVAPEVIEHVGFIN